jgi:hypothetical protein
MIGVNVGKVCPWQGVKLIHQANQLVIEDLDGTVNVPHACGTILAALSQLIRAATDLPNSDQHHLPSAIVVQTLHKKFLSLVVINLVV